MQVQRHVRPLCEVGCGLESSVEAGEVVTIGGNRDHVLSRGHICPKALGIKELHSDSDRLLTASSGRPMADGSELDPLSGTAVLNGIPVQICTAPMRGDFDG